MSGILSHISNLKIRTKLLLGYVSAFIILLFAVSLIVYPIIQRAIEANVESELSNTTKTILGMIKASADASIKNYLRAIAEKNRDIVSHYYQQSRKGILTEQQAKQEAGKALLSQTIGKTGYIFVWNVKKAPESIPLAVHPKIQGEDVAYVDFVQKGAQIKNGYMEYSWKNPGEEKAREKAMYLAYFKPWNWLIAASSYREEFMDLINVDYLRDSILSIRFGKTGYPYILDSRGNIIIHPALTGNVYDVRDASGRQFVQEICKQKNGRIIYAWRNPGEKEFRKKLVVFNYIPEFDWIVASSSYLEEFYEPLHYIRGIIIAIFIVSLAFLSLLTLVYSTYIVKNVNRLIHGFRTGSSGDLTVRITETSKDEFGSLAEYFNNFMEKLNESNQLLHREIDEHRQSEANYRSVIDNIQDVFYRSDNRGNLIMASPSLLILLGYDSLEDCLGRPVDEAYYYNQEKRSDFLRQIKDKGSVANYELILKKRDGTPVTVETNSHFYLDDAGNIAGIEGTFRDITERKKVEKELQKERDINMTLLQTSPAFLVVISGEGKTIMMNHSMLSALGYTDKEVVGKDYIATFVPEHDREELSSVFRQIVIKGEATINENRILARDGREILVEWHGRPVYNSKGDFEYFFGMGTDITERRRAEANLREITELQKAILDSAVYAIISTTPEGIIRTFNPAAERMLGYSAQEMIGRLTLLSFHDQSEIEQRAGIFAEELDMDIEPGFEVFVAKARRHLPNEHEWTYIHKGGSRIPVLLAVTALFNAEGEITGFLGIASDITARKYEEDIRKQLEEKLIQAQKMEAIGTLAGGIAHDFNNILSGIMGYSEISLKAVQDRPKVHQNIEQVLKAAERAKDLVQQILAFSRKAAQEKKPIALAAITGEVVRFMRASLPTTIEITSQIEDTADVILADPTQMHQVLMNICTNAGQAMKETGGVLEVGLKEAVMDAGNLIHHPALKFGRYLELSVRDTGRGIPQKNLGRIFDPYFTTKEKGEGTGLGLAVVHGIVKDHSGEITVYSEVGKGTIFRVYLPVMEKQAESAKEVEDVVLPGKGETILFVDDEEMIVTVNKQLLEILGYKVFTATDPLQAIEIFKEGHEDIDLVITDKTMPHMTGFDFIKEIRSLRADIPVIICSGFQEKEDMKKLADLRIGHLLTKPVKISVLAKAIREVLEIKIN